jgi:hypothetical protein
MTVFKPTPVPLRAIKRICFRIKIRPAHKPLTEANDLGCQRNTNSDTGQSVYRWYRLWIAGALDKDPSDGLAHVPGD